MGKGFASPAQYRGDDVKGALTKNWRALVTHLNSYVPTFTDGGTNLSLPGDLAVTGALTVGTLPAIDHGADVGGLGDDDHTQYHTDARAATWLGTVAAVQSFSPAWTAASSAPAIGNGSIDARYIQVGDLVTMWARISMGSTTTFGSGEWYLALPTAAATAAGYGAAPGPVWVFDSSTSQRLEGFCWLEDTTKVQFSNHAATTNWAAAAPIAWGSGDVLSLTFTYVAA